MLRIAIVGFGNAGMSAVKTIRAARSDVSIDVYSDRDQPPANPMLTTYYVKGQIPYSAMFPHGDIGELENRYGFSFHGNTAVVRVIPEKTALILSDGTEKSFDRILIATGASPIIPRGEGMDLSGVLSVRTPEDAVRLKSALDGGVKSVLVVGASMAGIKIAELASARGLDVTMIDGAEYMFPTAALRPTAEKIQEFLTEKGVKLAFSAMISKITDENGQKTAITADGRKFSADLIVMCIGTRANTGLVAGTSIETGRAIKVDRTMQTSAPGIYAAGDCCEGYELQWGGRVNIGLWMNAADQGETAGANMAGIHREFDRTILCNISHFYGMDFVGMGYDPEKKSAEEYSYESDGLYIRAVRRQDGRVGVINILGHGEISGIVKNQFMKTLSGAGGIDDSAIASLKSAGIPDSFLRFIGGKI